MCHLTLLLVFLADYHVWSLGLDEHWETVFSVSENAGFQFLPPVVWTPLTSTVVINAFVFTSYAGHRLH